MLALVLASLVKDRLKLNFSMALDNVHHTLVSLVVCYRWLIVRLKLPPFSPTEVVLESVYLFLHSTPFCYFNHVTSERP